MEGNMKTKKDETTKDVSEIDSLNRRIKLLENLFHNSKLFEKMNKTMENVKRMGVKVKSNEDLIINLKEEIKKNQLSQSNKSKETVKIDQKDLKKTLKCDKCNLIVQNKKVLKDHMRTAHEKRKEIICDICSKTVFENWEIEVHSKEHNKLHKFNCTKCNKTFLLEWRLKKHLENHSDSKKIFCHYFNNKKPCPFEEIGCMFTHEKSKLCRNDIACERILCQFRHKNFNHVKDKNPDSTIGNKEHFEKENGNKVTNSKNGEFNCDQCTKIFKNKNDLKEHKQADHKVKLVLDENNSSGGKTDDKINKLTKTEDNKTESRTKLPESFICESCEKKSTNQGFQEIPKCKKCLKKLCGLCLKLNKSSTSYGCSSCMLLLL